jgi:hypothetical protein
VFACVLVTVLLEETNAPLQDCMAPGFLTYDVVFGLTRAAAHQVTDDMKVVIFSPLVLSSATFIANSWR